jgi:hypothetical protein
MSFANKRPKNKCALDNGRLAGKRRGELVEMSWLNSVADARFENLYVRSEENKGLAKILNQKLNPLT